MSNRRQPPNRVKSFRQQRGWSQAELAQRAGISRGRKRDRDSASGAVRRRGAGARRGAGMPRGGSVRRCCRRGWGWLVGVAADPGTVPVLARAGGRQAALRSGRADRRRRYSARRHFRARRVATEQRRGAGRHVGHGQLRPGGRFAGWRIRARAACACWYCRRSSRDALDLLRRGLVDVAGTHLATAENQEGNASAARSTLGTGYSLLKMATWQEGLAVGPGVSTSSVGMLLRSRLRWVGREPGSGARQCQDELLRNRSQPRRLAKDHRGVAEAIRCGWANVGVCVRLTCEEAGLKFIQIRDEAYDLCFPTTLASDPRLRACCSWYGRRTTADGFANCPDTMADSAGKQCRSSRRRVGGGFETHRSYANGGFRRLHPPYGFGSATFR